MYTKTDIENCIDDYNLKIKKLIVRLKEKETAHFEIDLQIKSSTYCQTKMEISFTEMALLERKLKSIREQTALIQDELTFTRSMIRHYKDRLSRGAYKPKEPERKMFKLLEGGAQ